MFFSVIHEVEDCFVVILTSLTEKFGLKEVHHHTVDNISGFRMVSETENILHTSAIPVACLWATEIGMRKTPCVLRNGIISFSK
ncbi:hypothetical protein K3495_g3022 [Podosphaera aphanis]|nr:hypothetical protein K3495_g3022 [Podosphaera aphanis]